MDFARAAEGAREAISMSARTIIREDAELLCPNVENGATCRAGDPLFAAISQCLSSASRSCRVIDDCGAVLGTVTLESLRRAIRAGELMENATIAESAALLRIPAN